MLLYEQVPSVDEGRIVILSTLGLSFLLICTSTLIVLIGNTSKMIVLTPVYCEYSKADMRFNTHWRELQPLNASFLGYKWTVLNGVIPDKKGKD